MVPQESLFAAKLVDHEMKRFWGDPKDTGKKGPSAQFNDDFYRNTFRIGGAELGVALAKRGMFDNHLKLNGNGWKSLRHLMFSMSGEVLNEELSQLITKLDASGVRGTADSQST